MSRKPSADHWSESPRGERSALPSVQHCYDHANSCLDMWNDFVDYTARSWLLRMADAWMQLASESDKQRRAAHTGEAEQQFQRKPITDSDRCRAVWL